jgi:hypothetical protein
MGRDSRGLAQRWTPKLDAGRERAAGHLRNERSAAIGIEIGSIAIGRTYFLTPGA